MPTTKTPLNEKQLLRLIMLLDTSHKIINAYIVQIDDTPIKKFVIVYEDHEESYYPPDEDIDFVLNGIKVERNPA